MSQCRQRWLRPELSIMTATCANDKFASADTTHATSDGFHGLFVLSLFFLVFFLFWVANEALWGYRPVGAPGFKVRRGSCQHWRRKRGARAHVDRWRLNDRASAFVEKSTGDCSKERCMCAHVCRVVSWDSRRFSTRRVNARRASYTCRHVLYGDQMANICTYLGTDRRAPTTGLHMQVNFVPPPPPFPLRGDRGIRVSNKHLTIVAPGGPIDPTRHGAPIRLETLEAAPRSPESWHAPPRANPSGQFRSDTSGFFYKRRRSA